VLVPPGAFLPAAERYNLATRIDQWVITHVFDWLDSDPEIMRKIDSFAINLSGQSLGDKSILEMISRQLARQILPAEMIKFEITETSAISNLTEARSFINAVKKQGCQFSLDDFGSGLSSFGYLKHLSVDILKIDGMFVKDIMDDEIDFAMVKSINEIGHVMGLETIAEFVENDAILQRLASIGVDYAQGYGVCRPMPLDELMQHPMLTRSEAAEEFTV
jgi:EAL domain-containing protein (putative c-di-GMP-specific phosphodiesterase class I)